MPEPRFHQEVDTVWRRYDCAYSRVRLACSRKGTPELEVLSVERRCQRSAEIRFRLH